MATFKVSTRKDKTSAEVITALTINMNATPEVRDALAMQALVVKVQGQWRKHGIPAAASINMADFAPGTRHAAPVQSPLELAQAMSPEERAKYIEQLKAMG